MKFLLSLVLASALAGCGTLSKADGVLESRLAQLETSVSKVKSDAIAEAKDATADLIGQATEKFETTGKEVIDHAVSEMDAKLEKRLEQIEEIVKERQSQATADIKGMLKEDVPMAIEKSVVNSADKIAERLGMVKKTVPGPDGISMEVWALGGTAAAGFLGFLINTIRNYLNSKAGKKRWTEEELATKVRQCMNGDHHVRVSDSHDRSCSHSNNRSLAQEDGQG